MIRMKNFLFRKFFCCNELTAEIFESHIDKFCNYVIMMTRERKLKVFVFRRTYGVFGDIHSNAMVAGFIFDSWCNLCDC